MPALPGRCPVPVEEAWRGSTGRVIGSTAAGGAGCSCACAGAAIGASAIAQGGARALAGASRCGQLGGATSAVAVVPSIMQRGNAVTACVGRAKK